MKIIKNLTVANIKKIEGMVRREDLDFNDDGNHFRGFEYKGMPITTLRSQDTTYLSIRVDYLKNLFTHNEWSNTDEYKLTDEFNGVYEFNLDKLIENLEKIINKVNELNEAAKKEEIDMTAVKVKVEEEIKMAQEVVDDFKKNFEWWNVSSNYQLTKMADYLKRTVNTIERVKHIDFDNMPRINKKTYIERLESYGYVEIKKDNFYLNEMREAIA